MTPCPFCGSSDSLSAIKGLHGEAWIACQGCKAYGPQAFDTTQASELWENRAAGVYEASRSVVIEQANRLDLEVDRLRHEFGKTIEVIGRLRAKLKPSKSSDGSGPNLGPPKSTQRRRNERRRRR